LYQVRQSISQAFFPNFRANIGSPMYSNKSIFKYIPVIAAFLTLLSFPAQAQESETGGSPYFTGERKFIGGIVAGANLCQIDGDAYYGYNKLGLNAGGIVYWNFSGKIGASLELLFSQKGVRGIDEAYSPYVGPYFGKYYLNLNYVEVPLIVHYYLTPKYHFGLGASYSQLISSSEKYYGVDPYFFTSDKYPFEKSAFDFVVSGSMVLWRGLMANVRYHYSITKLRSPEYVPVGFGYGNQNQMNNMFMVRLMYLF
jgi:hypothetical protein